jgi:Response regulator containing a CheY-like receiver domain and an HD-GYP domain
MKKRNSSVLGLIRVLNYILLIAIFLILLAIVFLYKSNTSREYDDKSFINVFGKQRMYTQMISKDVNRLYYLLQERNHPSDAASGERINKEITNILINLEDERNQYSNNLEAFHHYEIKMNGNKLPINKKVIDQSKYLIQIDATWNEFDQALHIILNSDGQTEKLTDATNYISNNNMRLLSLSDSLLQEVLNSSVRKDKKYESILYSLIGIIALIVIISVFSIKRFLFQPFEQLYKGITEIGLSDYPIRHKVLNSHNLKPMVDEVNGMFVKINRLISLIENMNNNYSFTEVLTYINETFSAFIPYNYIGIALLSQDKKVIKATYGVSDGTIDGLPEKVLSVSWYISETSLGTVLESGEARIINDLEAYCAGKPLKVYNKALLESGIRASITLPLKVAGEAVGLIFFSSKRKNVYTKEHTNLLETLANSIAISMNNNILTNEIVYSSILALAKLSEARDEDTGEHLDRMAKYSRLIARLLYENELYQDAITLEYIERIEKFSPLHDIGKVGIMDHILLKPAKLTEEEFEEMKKHAAFGGQVLRAADKNMQDKGISLFDMGVEIAEAHHEKWDGSGYPFGKQSEEIPLSARIVALADVFDALTSKRPYKKAFSLDTSFQIIEDGRGKHFDPLIVNVFLKNRKKIEELYYKFNK